MTTILTSEWIQVQSGGEDADLPIDVGHWLLVVLPIAVLLFLYVGRRWAGPEAGPIGLALVAVIAYVSFETPVNALAVAAGKGVWDAVPILLVIFAALLLYRIGTAAGAFYALRRGVERYSTDPVFLVLAFGWVFTSFAQGIAGFGAPIAIVAPILLSLGVRPVYAVVIPLIGHAWANFFGTLGVGWLATLQVVEVDDPRSTAVLTSLLLFIPIAAAGLAIAWMVGRTQAVVHALPLVGILTLIMGGVQLGVVLVSPELSTFLGASAALLAIAPLSRWKRYTEDPGLEDLPAMDEDEHGPEDEDAPEPIMGLPMALAPYGVLTVLSVAVLAIGPVEDFLGRIEVAPPFPEISTGLGVETEAEESYEPLEPLSHPGVLLLYAAVAAWALYRWRGYFGTWRDRGEPAPIWRSTVTAALPAATAVVTFLVLSSIFSHSGQVDVLALGIASVTSPAIYAFLSNYIGVAGALVTNSSTTSNILFAPLQDGVATSEDLSQSAILAGQSVGGSIGNVVAPVNVVLGTGAVGISGKEGEVMRKAAVWLIPVAALVGLATMPLVLF